MPYFNATIDEPCDQDASLAEDTTGLAAHNLQLLPNEPSPPLTSQPAIVCSGTREHPKVELLQVTHEELVAEQRSGCALNSVSANERQASVMNSFDSPVILESVKVGLSLARNIRPLHFAKKMFYSVQYMIQVWMWS